MCVGLTVPVLLEKMRLDMLDRLTENIDLGGPRRSARGSFLSLTAVAALR
jgi:hypothetical protein